MKYIIHMGNAWNDISRNNKSLIVKPKKHTFISALSQNLCTYHYLSTGFKHCIYIHMFYPHFFCGCIADYVLRVDMLQFNREASF